MTNDKIMSYHHSQGADIQPLAGLGIAARRFHREPARLHLLHGHSGVFVAGLVVGGAAKQSLAVIDGAVRFNSYTLSKVAEHLGIAPKILLQRTYVTRSFTAFQTEAAITIKLPRFLATHPCRLAVILGLLDTYYDEQVNPRECRQSLQRVMRRLRELVEQNIQILIADVEIPDPPQGKENLFGLVRNAADIVTVLEPRGGGFHFIEERKTQLWDETTILSRSSSKKTERNGINSAGR